MRQQRNLAYKVAKSKSEQPDPVTGAEMLSEGEGEPASKRRKKAKGKQRSVDRDK